MTKYGECCKATFEGFEGIASGFVEQERDVFASKPSQWNGDFGVVVDKAAVTVEVGEPEEGLDVFNGRGFGPIDDGGEFLRVHLDAVSADDEPKIFDLRLVPFTLSGIGAEAGSAKAIQNEANIDVVFLLCTGENEDVVEVYDAADVEDVPKDVLDECLEGGGGVGEAVRDDKVFEEAEMSSECSLPFVTFFDTDVGVRGNEIEDREDLATLNAI